MVKNMDQHIADIDQDPFGRFHALPMQDPNPVLLEALDDMVRNGPDLPVGAALGNDEIMGNARQLGDVKDNGMLGFFIFGGFDREASDFFRLQKVNSLL